MRVRSVAQLDTQCCFGCARISLEPTDDERLKYSGVDLGLVDREPPQIVFVNLAWH
jgi:hypothetical protein